MIDPLSHVSWLAVPVASVADVVIGSLMSCAILVAMS